MIVGAGWGTRDIIRKNDCTILYIFAWTQGRGEDGSLVMVQKKGSRRKKAPRVILYCGSDPSARDGQLFFLDLFWKLMAAGREKGYEIFPVMDGRSGPQLGTPPAEVQAMLKDGKADGIIGIMLFQSMLDWIRESGLPHVALFEGRGTELVNFDYLKFIDLVFDRFAELDCQSIGMMLPNHLANADRMEHMDKAAARTGLKINYEWILVSMKNGEFDGYSRFCSLWGMKQKPDGLAIFPDITARGAVTAMLEKNVKVPGKIKLILHRNAQTPYPVPFACDWVENSTASMTAALWSQLEAQWRGDVLREISVPFSLVKG